MKIAFICYWSCPLLPLGELNAGGMNVYVLNLVKALADLGHQVDIYTKKHKIHHDKSILFDSNIKIIHFSNRFKNLIKDTDYFTQKLSKYINSHKLHYDIIHAHYYYSAMITNRVSSQLKIPYVVNFHTLSIIKKVLGGIRDINREKQEIKIVQQTQALIASTVLEKNDLIKYYQAKRKKIHVISPGVDHQLFKKYDKKSARRKLKLPQTKKIILFVGRIDPIKGISLLINSIAYLTTLYPTFENQFRVYLIGGDISSRYFWKTPEVLKIKHLILENHLSCCVKFIGSKAHQKLPFYYNASDIVVMPSSYESFGLVVLEAMACGSVVLASRVGGLKYLIKDEYNGKLFKSGDKKDLSEALWNLVNNKKKLYQMGQRAIITSQKYCWDKQAKKIIQVYNKII